MKKSNLMIKFWLTMLILVVAIVTNGQTPPKKPNKAEHGYPERMVRNKADKNKSSEIPPQEIEIPVLKTKNTKATCQYDNAGLASLSSSALVSYLKQTDEYACHAGVLFNYDSYYSPLIFSNANIQAVLNEIYNSSASFDGTKSAGLFGLLTYIHVAGYHEFFQPGKVVLDQTSKNLYIQACDALSQNSHLLDLNADAANVCGEFIVILDYPGVRNRTRTFDFMKKVMRDLTIYDTWKQAADIKWITGRWNIFFLMFRGTQDPVYMQALANDPSFITLMNDVGIDSELRANEDLLFMADNALGELARIATDASVKDQVCGYLASIANMFPRLDKNWLKAVIALTDAGKCAQYNLCENEASLRVEVEQMLFPNTFTYNDGKLVFRSKFGKETADMLYYATRQSESQFFRLGQTDEPVAGDVNNVLTAIVFEDITKYEDYAPFLYGIATNNGGMYMEQPSEFYTWDRPDTYSLSLEVLFRHEYVHYLQGRYWVPGYWGSGDIYANGKLVWFEEGSAELCSGGTDTEGIKLRSSTAWTCQSDSPNWPTVSEIINSNYNTPGFIYYPYGNLLWYYIYKNEPQRIKPLIDAVRANNSATYDATMTSMKNDATLQTNFKNFMTQVANGTITSWDPTTNWVDDKYLSLSNATDIKSAFTSITGNSSAIVSLDATGCIGRFKITGQITGQGTASSNSAAALKVEQALNTMMNQLKADEWVNNFNYIVGYFENVTYTSSIPRADFTITGSLKNADMPNVLFANFEADQTTSLTGVNINFTNTSLGSINSANWNFQGGTPTTSSNRDVTVKYNTAGQYNVSLTVSGQNSSDTRTKSKLINIYSKSNVNYCTPVHTTPQVREIQAVTAGGVYNESSFGLVNGYSDYTDLLVKFVKGQQNTIRVDATIMSTTYAANHLGIWIDYNSNGTFETSEKVTEIIGTEALYAQGYYQTTINVPSNAISTPTKMRVRHAWISTGEVIDPCATYAEGEVEDYSIVFVGASDNTAPTAPTLTKSGTTLSWSGASDNVGVTEYEVLYDNIIIGITSNTSYAVSGLTAGKNYSFTVKAKDAAGNISNPSNTVIINNGTSTYTLTTSILGQGSVSPANGTYTSGTVVQLTATPASGYQFSGWSGSLTGTANPASLTMNANKSVTASFSQTTNIPPTVSISSPTNGASFDVGNNVTINATAGDTDGNVTKVEFFQGSTKLGEDSTSPYSFSWSNVQVGNYTLTAKATDNQGAVTTSSAVSISVADLPPPYCAASANSGPEGIAKVVFGSINNSSTRDAAGYHNYTALSTNVSKGTSYNLAVTIIPYSDGSSNEAYAWFDWNIDGDFTDAGEYVMLTKPLTLGNATITVPAGAKSGTTRMRIRVAYDAASNVPCGAMGYGEVEDYTIIVGGEATCTNPLTAPSNLTSPSKTTNSISLSWAASTGGTSPCSPFANYNVYRNGALVGSPTNASFTDSGLNPSTTYSYTVRAKDAAGSLTSSSNTLNVTTSAVVTCTNPVTTPSNLASSGKTTTTVSLNWTASTGGTSPCPAFSNYIVYREGVAIGSPTSNSFTDTGLKANTSYTYTVKAKDATGGFTSASNSLNVTTLADAICTSYCTSKGSSVTYEWISNVSIGSFNNASNAAGYSDFTTKTINLPAGSTFNVALSPGFGSSSYTEHWKIWVDFNKDCDFDDAGEEIYYNYASTSVGGNITIPASASGETTMRISMKYNNMPTPCETFSYGEVEDYKVSFTAKSSKILIPTVIAENKALDAEIYPNPTSNQFTINLIGENSANIQLVGMNGSIISQSEIENASTTVDVSNIPSGMYYVKITTQNNSLVKKLIVR